MAKLSAVFFDKIAFLYCFFAKLFFYIDFAQKMGYNGTKVNTFTQSVGFTVWVLSVKREYGANP